MDFLTQVPRVFVVRNSQELDRLQSTHARNNTIVGLSTCVTGETFVKFYIKLDYVWHRIAERVAD